MYGMKNKIFKLDKSIEKPLFIFALIFGAIVAIIVVYLQHNDEEISTKVILDKQRHSRIVRIFRVKEEHNYIYIKLSTGHIANFNKLYKVGDSLSKNKGDSIEYIFRNGEVIQNNLIENYRKSTNYKYLRAKSVTLSCK